jgi:Cytochrome P460
MNAARKRIIFSLCATVAVAAVIASIAPSRGHAQGGAVPDVIREKPAGYRDWVVISESHEAGNINSIGAVLGNDVAVKAYRAGTLPFPDGTIIAALHYKYVPSDENNKIFGQMQSFVAGEPTNVQFEAKDSKKYAATGGWAFGHFNADGTLGSDAVMKTCAPCHARASRDHVFTRYAP